MKHWFKDQHFRSLLKNSSYLAASRIVAAIAGIATISFAAHALALLLFGALDPDHQLRQGGQRHRQVPIVAADRPLRRPRAVHGERRGFQDLHRLCVRARRAERRSAACSSPSRSCRSSRNGSASHRDQLWLAMLYCTLLPTMGAATPSGVLRALDRFDLISWQSTADADQPRDPGRHRLFHECAVREPTSPSGTSPISAATSTSGSSPGASFAGAACSKASDRRLRPETLPGAWRFAIHVNLDMPASRLPGDRSPGWSSAVFWAQRARRSSGSRRASRTAQPSPPICSAKAFYPEVVRMDLTSRKPWKLMLRGTALASAVALLAILILLSAGKPLISFSSARNSSAPTTRWSS